MTKRIFTFSSETRGLLLFIVLAFALNKDANAQSDSSKFNRIAVDTPKLNMDAVYNRPFLQYGKIPLALGGYMEANTQYSATLGVSEGITFQMRRMTLFASSSIHRKIKFLTEIEFEDGTKEINIEFAALDIQMHHLLNFRGGIVMNPIGAFNQNHDGPRWEFIDRPVSATQLLPATFSNTGFGIYGKTFKPKYIWAYEFYLTNGFNNLIVDNAENKTFLPAAKLNPNRFEESFNGIPLSNAKTSLRLKKIGEIGLSYMGGVYNKFTEDGLRLDKKRRIDVMAIDFNTNIAPLRTAITTEFVWTFVDVPENYSQQYGNRQRGGFLDIIHTLIRKEMFGFEKASLYASVRLEYVDWNIGTFRETGGNIFEEFKAVVPSISFRSSAQTVFRFNYRYEWRRDILGNPFQKTTLVQFGLSTYF